ncbi:thiosulfate sulfurtransferase/rhodanese-like domain-containing protein 3 [Asterias rubens]|uniref:thiosulfate sulfurtransferase/rhodanese-like domain-containing protein 3 n=1 Tax=Asterias rubens TaxID=7604 RepID=UPI0014553B41|nr:thiosulfate sulfurtransferase/rhodanese-like domain-containing protein 3 [Asterias rubens]
MATVVNRILTAATVLNCRAGLTFGRRLACTPSSLSSESSHRLPSHQVRSFHRLIFKNPLQQQSQSTCVKSQVQFCRAWSSDSSVLEEDDVNVFYEGLVKRIESRDVQLIDVREAAELAEFGQITGSTHIPLGELADSLRLPEEKFEMKYKSPRPKEADDNIVFHCRSGVRSLNAVNLAKELGFTKARHFPGGWLQWAEKNNLPSA